MSPMITRTPEREAALWVGRTARLHAPTHPRHDQRGVIVTAPDEHNCVCLRWADGTQTLCGVTALQMMSAIETDSEASVRSAVIVPLRWAALCGLLGHEIAKDLVPEAAVEAIPGLVASARNWLLTEAPISVPLRQAVEHAPADLELVAAALSVTASHGRGWDAMAACRDLGLTQGQVTQPGGLTPLQELLVESIEDHSRTLSVYAAALRSRDAQRIAAVEVRVADTTAHMSRCADALRAG